MASTWQTPKLNWQATDVLTADDFNRIEGNTQYLKETQDAHVNASSGVHGITGDVVGTTDSQTLTNKILGSNTLLGADLNANSFKITNLGDPVNDYDAANKKYIDDLINSLGGTTEAHALATSNVHGVTGNVVGTTDEQTLTNKILGSGTKLGADLDANFNSIINIEKIGIGIASPGESLETTGNIRANKFIANTTDLCNNLNADLLDGKHASDFDNQSIYTSYTVIDLSSFDDATWYPVVFQGPLIALNIQRPGFYEGAGGTLYFCCVIEPGRWGATSGSYHYTYYEKGELDLISYIGKDAHGDKIIIYLRGGRKYYTKHNADIINLDNLGQSFEWGEGNYYLKVYPITDISSEPPYDNDPEATFPNAITWVRTKRSTSFHSLRSIYTENNLIALGKIGIGTSSPSKTLHVIGDAEIDGAITINPPSTSAPFTLGSNAQNQWVEGLNADLLDGKHAPLGDIVGTSDEQTLTNKILGSGTKLGDDLDADNHSILGIGTCETSTLRRPASIKYITIPQTSNDNDFQSVAQLIIGNYLSLIHTGYDATTMIGWNAKLDYSSTSGGSLGIGNYIIPYYGGGWGFLLQGDYRDRISLFSINWGGSGRKKFPDDFTEILRIKGSGAIGIGTSAPSEKLEIAGNVKANKFIANTTDLCTNLNANLLEGYHASDFVHVAGDTMTGDLTVNGNVSATNLYASQLVSTNRLETDEGIIKFYGTYQEYIVDVNGQTYFPPLDGLPVRDNAKAYLALVHTDGDNYLFAYDDNDNTIVMTAVESVSGSNHHHMVFIPKRSDGSFKVKATNPAHEWTIMIIGDIL